MENIIRNQKVIELLRQQRSKNTEDPGVNHAESYFWESNRREITERNWGQKPKETVVEEGQRRKSKTEKGQNGEGPGHTLENQKMGLTVLMMTIKRETYAVVLGKLRQEVNSETGGGQHLSDVTQKGDVPISLDRKSNKKDFTAEVKRMFESLG